MWEVTVVLNVDVSGCVCRRWGGCLSLSQLPEHVRRAAMQASSDDDDDSDGDGDVTGGGKFGAGGWGKTRYAPIWSE